MSGKEVFQFVPKVFNWVDVRTLENFYSSLNKPSLHAGTGSGPLVRVKENLNAQFPFSQFCRFLCETLSGNHEKVLVKLYTIVFPFLNRCQNLKFPFAISVDKETNH